MRYIIFVGDKQIEVKCLSEAITKAKKTRETIKNTVGKGVDVKVFDTFCQEYISF